MNNIEQFRSAYLECLFDAINNYPEEYGFSAVNAPIVVDKMIKAIANNSFNKDGRAIKNTCKELNIPYTYKAIVEYIKG